MNSSETKLTVLMSTYNGVAYLREQIDSIIGQTGDFSLRLLVRDDGSADGTVELLRAYEAQGKLRCITGDNLRPAQSFMELVLQAEESDYYAFADQDDVWLDGKLSAALAALAKETGPALYFSNAELVDAQLQSLGRRVYRECPALDLPTLSCAGGLLGCTMVMNRALAALLRQRERPGKMVMHDFYVALVCAAVGGKILYEDCGYLQYRQHGNNVVGVSHGFLQTIKARLHSITTAPAVTVDEQSAEVLTRYESLMPPENAAWLRRVAGYRNHWYSRMGLAFSGKTRYVRRNKAVELRLALLWGNR